MKESHRRAVVVEDVRSSFEDLFTRHARIRMTGRRLSEHDVTMVLDFGRRVHGRGAQIYVIGRKEVARYRRDGIDLSAVEGIHVVCSRKGRVLTTYRNRDLSGIRKLR